MHVMLISIVELLTEHFICALFNKNMKHGTELHSLCNIVYVYHEDNFQIGYLTFL